MNKFSFKLNNGSITIFLALSLTLIISVIMSTAEFSRRIAISSYLEGVTQIGMDSVFSSYCTQLWEDYNVFATITSNSDFKTNLSNYISKNLENDSLIFPDYGTFLSGQLKDISIEELSNLTDNYGECFINQVLYYMQYKEITYIADYLLASSDIDYDPSELCKLASGDLSADAFEALDFGALVEMATTANNNFITGDLPTDISLPDSFSIDSLKSIAHILDETLIYYVVESPSDISPDEISTIGLPSQYLSTSNELGKLNYSTLDKFIFCEYLINHFSSYTTEVKDFSPKYQLEYLLCGHDNDKENLLDTAKKLVLMRFGFNVIHILSDSAKIKTVSSVANVTSVIPALPIIIEVLLICLWALAESVIDVRDLLAGESIPLFKTTEDWTLSFDNMLTFSYDTESCQRESSGLNYNNYLEILLMNTNIHILAARALDLIQLDFSTTINDSFSIINCIVGASCTFEYFSSDIFSSVNFYHNTLITPDFAITHNYYYH